MILPHLSCKLLFQLLLLIIGIHVFDKCIQVVYLSLQHLFLNLEAIYQGIPLFLIQLLRDAQSLFHFLLCPLDLGGFHHGLLSFRFQL